MTPEEWQKLVDIGDRADEQIRELQRTVVGLGFVAALLSVAVVVLALT